MLSKTLHQPVSAAQETKAPTQISTKWKRSIFPWTWWSILREECWAAPWLSRCFWLSMRSITFTSTLKESMCSALTCFLCTNGSSCGQKSSMKSLRQIQISDRDSWLFYLSPWQFQGRSAWEFSTRQMRTRLQLTGWRQNKLPVKSCPSCTPSAKWFNVDR